MKRYRQRCGYGRQRGATAVEFAIVFPVFFVICYAIISFGMIFAIQQSLTFAAGEGARAGLNYATDLTARMNNAQTTAMYFLGWLNVGTQQVAVSAPQCSYDTAPKTSPSLYCLSVTVNYTPVGWVATIPFMGTILTQPLTGAAVVQIPQSIL
ncbi:pilus assembly protein TadE [Burkholderia aenigmatica]|uniref:Pilus assembly protein TadE n=1 Tax=Burkholderia aenigmatica TaxID=2015348 RepID=A0A6J5JJU2_9BURK|nr:MULTISPECIES: TadE/TadG family type IV pilus assembly protein [Burkholderia]AYQ38248.1 pilus assembly protein TadE [Burkholderia lata]CAB3972113.1 pilus assembly protein TadE [Burkholderia aenigmatica]VWC53516.1 pilus assembly protein TadE [Burkholderia aenigmatica]